MRFSEPGERTVETTRAGSSERNVRRSDDNSYYTTYGHGGNNTGAFGNRWSSGWQPQGGRGHGRGGAYQTSYTRAEVRPGIYQPTVNNTAMSNLNCYRCGGAHFASQCVHRSKICNYCRKIGHPKRMCRMARAQEQ